MNPSSQVRVDAEPDTQYGFGDVENIIRRDIVSADEKRARLRQPLPDQEPARAEPEAYLPVRSRGMSQSDQVLADRRADRHVRHSILKGP